MDRVPWPSNMRSDERLSGLVTGQAEMLPLVLTGIRGHAQGQHIEFVGEVGSDTYYCKGDKNGRPLRATEWFCTSLANHLGIPVPDFAPVLNPENNDVLFGSKGIWQTASAFEVQTFLTTPPTRDRAIGDPYAWLGRYLSQLYALDVFLANPDRQIVNYLLIPGVGYRTLLAFDFASSDLRELSGSNFPIAGTKTLSVGRQLRKLRPFDKASAFELIDRIEAIPATVVDGFFASMPDDWMTESERGEISDRWSDQRIRKRLAALRGGISDESLL